MKKIILLISFVLSIGLARAQRFFYVDNNRITENLMKDGLLKASQFVTHSPLSSDYIIKTELGFQPGENILILQINMQDSLSFQTIYQTKETWTFGDFHNNSRILLSTVIRAFIENNIPRMVLSARNNHVDDQMKYLKSRKDKT